MLEKASNYQKIANEIYGKKTWRQKRRVLLFWPRACKNTKQMEGVRDFFDNYTARPHMLRDHLYLYEVINRVFFFKDSKATDRYAMLINHFTELSNSFKSEAIALFYEKRETDGIMLYRNEELELNVQLCFQSAHRKEGLLSIFIYCKGKKAGNINFCFHRDGDGKRSIFVGTFQGPVPGSGVDIKELTKKMFGYRPKNFTIFCLRELANILGIERIYAVSDEGFYSQSHMVRGNRTKQAEFNPFWEELGGEKSILHPMYYKLPVEEPRKTYDTMKTHKRNLYRKRYELLDGVIESFQMALQPYLQEEKKK